MARTTPKKGSADELEGFQPQKIERVLGEQPSAVREELSVAPKTELYLHQKDVPDDMKWTLPPVQSTSAPGTPTIQESYEAIEQMLADIKKKRSDRAVADANDPPRMRVARAAAEELSKVKVAEVEQNEQREESP